MAEILSPSEIFFTTFEPKSSMRFVMEIDNIPTFLIKAAELPKKQTGIVVLDHINIERKVKGKTRWQDINITLYDPIVPSGAQAVMEWMRTMHESVTGRNGYSDFYKKDIDFYQLGPIGDKISQWKVKGAWMSSIDFGNHDWAVEDAINITATLTYDFAILNF